MQPLRGYRSRRLIACRQTAPAALRCRQQPAAADAATAAWGWTACLPSDPPPTTCAHSNCGEDGFCRCPFGRLGEACEVDVLAPCRQFPDTHAYCGSSATKSCECLQRCKNYFCRLDSSGQTVCEGAERVPVWAGAQPYGT